MIPVLFTQSNSNYDLFDCFDTYNIERDAFTYNLDLPIIAHPPCRKFSRLRAFSTAPVAEKKCAFFALEKVRRLGGILEHPRSSTLWHTGNFNLSGHVDSYGGFLRSVNLSWFGFPAEKKTMLYFCGLLPGQLPPFPFSLIPHTHIITSSKKSALKKISKNSRSLTPIQMIEFFIEVMNIINSNKI